MTRLRLIAAIAWTLTAAWIVAVGLLLWPYDAVTFPQGNVATVSPSTVPELGTITVTFPKYCNDGQVVTVTRWADIYAPDGRRTASEQLGTLTFYPDPAGPTCFAPRVDEFGLTTAFQAYSGKGTTYRIRTVTAYSPNPIRTVRVEASTDPFVVTPN